jgi:hypothetical protein
MRSGFFFVWRGDFSEQSEQSVECRKSKTYLQTSLHVK